MVKPIHQRNFSVDKGDLLKTFMSYAIDSKGLETVLILHEFNKARVFITLNDGEVEILEYGNKYIKNGTFDEEEKKDLRNATEIYKEAKKILNVEEALKNYHYNPPKEKDLFSFMNIEDASQVQNYFLTD